MTRPSAFIPDKVWGSSTAVSFEEGFGPISKGQTLACVECCRRGEITTPKTVVMLNGTSLCVEHIESMV